jgi:hypothetical protein
MRIKPLREPSGYENTDSSAPDEVQSGVLLSTELVPAEAESRYGMSLNLKLLAGTETVPATSFIFAR